MKYACRVSILRARSAKRIGAKFAPASVASSKLRDKGQVRLKRLLDVFFLK